MSFFLAKEVGPFLAHSVDEPELRMPSPANAPEGGRSTESAARVVFPCRATRRKRGEIFQNPATMGVRLAFGVFLTPGENTYTLIR